MKRLLYALIILWGLVSVTPSLAQEEALAVLVPGGGT